MSINDYIKRYINLNNSELYQKLQTTSFIPGMHRSHRTAAQARVVGKRTRAAGAMPKRCGLVKKAVARQSPQPCWMSLRLTA